MSDIFSFGRWVRRRRKALDYTQAQLAAAIGCALQTIKKLEYDERRPSLEMAERLAVALHIPRAEHARFLRAARGDLAVFRLDMDATATRLSHSEPLTRTAHPIPPTVLLGREHELAALRRLLQQPHVRLVTLTGPPGIGKTRLALEAFSQLATELEECWYITLAPLPTADLVASAIAAALGIHESGGRSVEEELCIVLSQRRAVLLLDNFEHVRAAAMLVARLLAACPGLRILVTSREELRLRGEHVYRLATLAVPAAVALFAQRAAAAHHEFSLTPANKDIIAAICRRLDELPLAIELAAPQVIFFSPEALLARLETAALPMLVEGSHDLPPHQQTLIGAIRWSYELLRPHEQTLLRYLAAFQGGATIDAIEAVAQHAVPEIAVVLQRLVQQSLVQLATPSDPVPRFWLLETVREFADAQLQQASEVVAANERHARFYLQIAEQAAAELRSPRQAYWLALLNSETANLRAALEWALANATHLALRLASGLGIFWLARGQPEEGCEWLQRALAGSAEEISIHRAWGYYWCGMLRTAQSHPETNAHFEISLALFRQLGDAHGIALASCRLAARGSNPEVMVQACAESVAQFRVLGLRHGLADALTELLRVTAGRENTASSRALCDTYASESSLLYRELGDDAGLAASLSYRGQLALRDARLEAANDYLTEGVLILRSNGNRYELAWAVRNLAVVLLAQSAFIDAAQYASEAISLFRTIANSYGLALALWDRGRAQLALEQNWLAARDLEESVLLFREFGRGSGVTEVACCLWFARNEIERQLRLSDVCQFVAHNAIHDAPTVLEQLVSGMPDMLDRTWFRGLASAARLFSEGDVTDISGRNAIQHVEPEQTSQDAFVIAHALMLRWLERWIIVDAAPT